MIVYSMLKLGLTMAKGNKFKREISLHGYDLCIDKRKNFYENTFSLQSHQQ